MKKSKIKKAIQIIELMQKQGLNIGLFDKNVNISIVDGVLVFDKDKCFVSAKPKKITRNNNGRLNEIWNEVMNEAMKKVSEPLGNSEQLEDLKLSTKEIQKYALELGFKLGYNGKNYILSKANYELDYDTLKEVKEYLDQRCKGL